MRRWRRWRRAFTASTPEVVQTALTSFEGIARRQEVRGEARGVTVIDDFGHHPTAIRETLERAALPFPRASALGDFRAALEHDAARGFPGANWRKRCKLADGVFLAQIAALEQIPVAERLHPEAVVARSRTPGSRLFTRRMRRRSSNELCRCLQPNDVVTIFSNGGFDGIHEKLLTALA